MSGDCKETDWKKVEIVIIDKMMKILYKEAVCGADGYLVWEFGTLLPPVSNK